MRIRPAQCRGARELVDLSLRDLAQQSGVPVEMLAALEDGERIPDPDYDSIRRAFEAHGVQFTARGVTFGRRQF